MAGLGTGDGEAGSLRLLDWGLSTRAKWVDTGELRFDELLTSLETHLTQYLEHWPRGMFEI